LNVLRAIVTEVSNSLKSPETLLNPVLFAKNGRSAPALGCKILRFYLVALYAKKNGLPVVCSRQTLGFTVFSDIFQRIRQPTRRASKHKLAGFRRVH
jgi:hypothetical protein